MFKGRRRPCVQREDAPLTKFRDIDVAHLLHAYRDDNAATGGEILARSRADEVNLYLKQRLDHQ